MRTTTAVHDEQSRLAQQAREAAAGEEATLALAMAAQTLCYGALYVLPAAATAAWWAILCLLLPWTAMRGLARLLRRTAPPQAGDTPMYRLAALIFSLLFLVNMALCLLTLVELAHVFFFPDGSRLLLALAAALALGLGMPRDAAAVPNTARMLRWFLAAAFLFCAWTVLPAGEIGYLYPIAGYGVLPTLRCAAQASGSVWMAGVLAVLSPGQAKPGFLRGTLPGIRAILWIALLFLCCAYVLPGTSLGFQQGFALRIQLLMELSPSTLSWSLMLIAQMLLFLTGFAVCADLMRKSLRSALRVRSVPLLPFALACVPLAVRGMGASEEALTALLPWRYPAAAAALALCLASNLRRRRKA